jgi:hypothetical protein
MRKKKSAAAVTEKANSKTESWMEPTGYDSKEDEDYSQSVDGGDSKDSGSYVKESDGSKIGSDLSNMETDSVLDEVQPKAGKERCW